MRIARFRLTLATLLGACAISAQTPQDPAFEVASIKAAPPLDYAHFDPSKIGCTGGPGTSDPGRWICRSYPLSGLIASVFGFTRFQFTPPSWMNMLVFDIDAKVPAGANVEQFRMMKQNLVRERFQLEMHHEQKEMAVYEITVPKGGARIRKAKQGRTAMEPDPPGTIPKFTMNADGWPVLPEGKSGHFSINIHMRWTAYDVDMAEIVRTLSNELGRPVIDRTGLKDRYDIDMFWLLEPAGRVGGGAARLGGGDSIGNPADPGGPNLIRAIAEQLGFRLESKKAMSDIVVIDHGVKVPTEN